MSVESISTLPASTVLSKVVSMSLKKFYEPFLGGSDSGIKGKLERAIR